MAQRTSFASALERVAGETWALVYAFEAPRRRRGLWYDRWRYDVLNDYVEAAAALGVEPFIVDVDGFVACAAERAPDIDFVINLNSGATPISNLGLVPSLAEWNRLPCFPNSADVILTGERKDICRSVFQRWFNVPREATEADPLPDGTGIISKPKTMGNSQGVVRTLPKTADRHATIVEEFIVGFDVTIPVYYDLELEDYLVLPPIVYFPEIPQPDQWYLSYEQKMDRNIVIDRDVRRPGKSLSAALREASRWFGFQSIARFDFRWSPSDPMVPEIDRDALWFLEINCLPTLRTDVNFLKSLKAHLEGALLPTPLDRIESDDIRALAFLLAQARLRATTR